MPRRFLATRQKAQSAVGDRLRAALVYDIERSNVEEFVGSHDKKLQLVKASVMGIGPPKMIAPPPEMLCVSQDDTSSLGLMITMETNSFSEDFGSMEMEVSTDVDFTRAEDFLQLETKIDAKKDHSVLKMALNSVSGSFMNALLSRYSLPTQRLAFIQQVASTAAYPQAMRSKPLGSSGSSGHDNKEFLVSCQFCGEMFSCTIKFQHHILTHPDPENKKFLCQSCGKRFNRADHLNRHAILHGESIFKCILCGEEFDRASHLDRHRRKNHPPAGQAPSQTPPLTPLATKGSSVSSLLSPPLSADIENTGAGTNLHLLAAVATPEDTEGLTPEELLQQEASKVVSQIIVSNMAMEEQVKKPKANVERPFQCDVCGRKFIRSTHLRRHMRIHTGEKPFACHICGHRYARGDYLRAHIHAHRRDRVHKCKHCNEIFHDLMRFAEHCQQMHRGENDDFGTSQTTTQDSPVNTDNFPMCEEAGYPEIAPQIIDTHGPGSPIPIITVAMEKTPFTTAAVHKPMEEIVIPAFSVTHSSLPSQFSSAEIFQAFSTTTPHDPPDPHSIFHNGSLSIPDTGNEVTIMSGKGIYDPISQLIIGAGQPSALEILSTHHGHV